ncbi:MAG: DUF4424 family protein [Rhizobiales bacterium]|nr:DUF4424 family protein [Hyphomicrobiales bacterium]
MRGRNAAYALLSATAFAAGPAFADSSIELGVGGLTFGRDAQVTVESQDIHISPEAITIRYRVGSASPQSVTVTMDFPLPDIDMSDPDTLYAIPVNDPANFVGAQTKVNGQPVKFDIRQRAVLGDKDITDRLRGAGLPILPMTTQGAEIAALNEQAREKLVAEGLISPNGVDGEGKTQYAGAWTVKTVATRQQTLPAGTPIAIEHRYRASVGISFDTLLRKTIRESQGMDAEFKRYRSDYCIPDSLLRGIDKAAGGVGNVVKLQERRINYAMRNNPDKVKDLRIVIDKGRADNLVSFCLDNVKKISATAFEFRAKDFVPERDLKILLITKPDGKVPIAQPDPPQGKPAPGSPDRVE